MRSERKSTEANARNLMELIEEDGPRVVRAIVDVSRSGRAAKSNTALFALALAAALGDESTKRIAYDSLPMIARTGTQLFQFVAESEELRGWGRGLRRAVGRWYSQMDLDDLVYQLIKCRQRNGWTHGDLLRLAHPVVEDDRRNGVFQWALRGESAGIHARIEAFERLQSARTDSAAARLIRDFDLPQEAVPTELLKSAFVWEALLERMPLTALVQNLATLSQVGLLVPGSDAEQQIRNRLMDKQRLLAARIHPISFLMAMLTYKRGRGLRSHNEWIVAPEVLNGLQAAFQLSFQSVEPTGLRHLLAIDVSGSMSWGQVAGLSITPAEAAAAMAMISVEVEESVVSMAFDVWFKSLPLRRGMSLTEVITKTRGSLFGRTDCALPMVWAKKHKVPVDVFVVYTDNETWYGKIHPFQALSEYREATGIAAKLVVVGIVSYGFSIADPADAGMLDIVGFDASVPLALREFALA